MARRAVAAGVAVAAVVLLLFLLWPRPAGDGGGANGVAGPGTPAPATAGAPALPSRSAGTENPGATAPPFPAKEGEGTSGGAADGGHGAHGRLVDADRRTAADVPVVLLLDGKTLAEARTGPDGEFRLPEIRVKAEGRSHFVFLVVARDGRGRAARDLLRMGVSFDPGEEREFTVSHTGLGTLVLREAAPLLVRVTAGGTPVEGAAVWAEEEAPGLPGTEAAASARDGVARIEDVPSGRWTVFAKAPGRGAGRVSADLPARCPVEVALSPRSLDVEAVDAGTGKPLEGVRFAVAQRRTRDGKEDWEEFFPPLDPPPTDSAGRTRIPDLGEVAVRLRPIPAGLEEPVEGTDPVDVDAGAAAVRVPVRGLRTVRWPVLGGERTPPPDGSVLVYGEERLLQDVTLPWAAMEGREGRVEKGEVVVGGLGWGGYRALARAPDGSLARLEAAPNAERGPPVRFLAPRRLTVVVRDEDGKPVPDPVALLAPDGEAVALPHLPEAEGRTVFDGLYAGDVVVCALARTEWGGAEVARVDLAAGDRTLEAVVGRAFTLVVRFREGGRPRIPASREILLLTPGPDIRGQPHSESPEETGEDAARGDVRLRVRPHAPGKPVVLRVTIPGREPIRREVLPPPAGEEAVVAMDL